MSYDPERENKSELMSTWNSASQTLPYKSSGSTVNYNLTLNLNTIGEGDCSLSSNILYPPEGLYGFFIGDLRVYTNTTSQTNTYGDIFSIGFANSDGDVAKGGNLQRNNRNDDACYSISSSANLKILDTFRIGGATIAPWVRVLGIMIEEG